MAVISASASASARGGTLGCEFEGDRAVLTGGAVTVIKSVMTV